MGPLYQMGKVNLKEVKNTGNIKTIPITTQENIQFNLDVPTFVQPKEKKSEVGIKTSKASSSSSKLKAFRKKPGKRFNILLSESSKPKRKKETITDPPTNMAFQYLSESENDDDSNSSNMRFYGEDNYSSPTHTSSHSSINSEHGYSLSPSSLTAGIEPIKFNMEERYLNPKVTNKPYLDIIVEPTEMYRFRYISEMSGMHGSIMGQSATNERCNRKNKFYPTIKLCNYEGDAKIVCTLIQNDENILNLHPNSLSVKANNQPKVNDPLIKIAGPHNDYTVIYKNLAVVQTARKDIGRELFRKRMELFKLNKMECTIENEKNIMMKCDALGKNSNMSCVRFLFVAYDMEMKRQLCKPVYSIPVFNQKSAESGALKISRMSKRSGSVKGGDEVFIFVEKVSKKNIQVRFFEYEKNEKVWEHSAKFSESDVHHQYGIVFSTPPYRDQKIETNKVVYVELYRPKDGAVSASTEFTYKPAAFHNKRRREAENSTSILSSIESIQAEFSVNGFENSRNIPSSVISFTDKCLIMNPMLSQPVDYNPMNPVGSIDDLPKNQLHPLLDSLELYKYQYLNHSNSLFEDIQTSTRIDHDGGTSSVVSDQTPIESNSNSLYPKADIITVAKVMKEIEKLVLSNSKTAGKRGANMVELRLSEGNCLQHFLVSLKQVEHLDTYLNMIKKFDLDYCLNYGNASGDTALHTAVTFYMNAFVGKLLLAGSDPDICNDEGDSPLHLAVKEENSECMVQLLLKSNYANDSFVNVNMPNAEGWTPLHLAVVRGALVDVSRLLLANADPNIKRKDNGRAALHLAVAGNHPILVDYLLKYPNVQIDVQGDGGETPLHLACTYDITYASEICERLLAAGADATKRWRNSTAIDLAKKTEDRDVHEVFQAMFPQSFKENSIKLEMEDDNPRSPDSWHAAVTPEVNIDVTDQKNNLIIKIKTEVEDYLFMDPTTSRIVEKSLATSGLWKDLALKLGYSDFVSLESTSNLRNPTSILLNLMEVQEKVTLKELQEALQNLNLTDAADAVKAIIKE